MTYLYDNNETYESSLFDYDGTPSFAVVTQTGTGSGTSTQVSTNSAVLARTATGSGQGSSTDVTRKKLFRLASGFGTSNQFASFYFARLGTGYAFGKAVEPSDYTYDSSTEYDDAGSTYVPQNITVGYGIVVRLRTGSAQGIGAGTTENNELLPRVGSASGLGGSTSTVIRVAVEDGTGSGLGSETAVGARTEKHIGTGIGVGSGTGTHPFIFTDGYWGTLNAA